MERGRSVGAYVPIPCGDYEMLELACMDGYDVEVHTDGRTIFGRADTLKVRDGEEFFVVRQASGGRESIRVDCIRHLIVRTRPARFETHTFMRANVPPIRGGPPEHLTPAQNPLDEGIDTKGGCKAPDVGIGKRRTDVQ